jgi:hypothetical protein
MLWPKSKSAHLPHRQSGVSEPIARNAPVLFAWLDERCSHDVEVADTDYQRALHLVERLQVILFDVRLDQIVPNDWITPTADGLVFSSLSLKSAERFIRTLEDILEGWSPEVSVPGTGQGSLF